MINSSVRNPAHAIFAASLICGLSSAPGAVIGAEQSLEAAITGGQSAIDVRLRYERVEQDNAAQDGDALTLRARLGYLTGSWHGFDAYAEYEGVYAIGGDDSYNSGPPVLDSTNGNTGFSTVADPTGDEVNRAWLRYSGLPDTQIKLGRQRLILDNARFFGNVGWRQDEQTFDALAITNTSVSNLTATYAYLHRQNFIFFNENRLNAHVLNLAWAADDALKLTAYGYFIDFRDETGPRVPGTPDHRTLGVRATGAIDRFNYTLEYADQADYADGPDTVDADYYLLELAASLGPVTPKLGYEVLGGDGVYGFATPFGTNHAFQGWADLFLNTPPGGIRDLYAGLSGKLGKYKLAAVYHDFQSDAGGLDYGSEIDLLVARPLTKRLSALLKFADYSADEFAVDTRRYWMQLEFKF